MPLLRDTQLKPVPAHVTSHALIQTADGLTLWSIQHLPRGVERLWSGANAQASQVKPEIFAASESASKRYCNFVKNGAFVKDFYTGFINFSASKQSVGYILPLGRSIQGVARICNWYNYNNSAIASRSSLILGNPRKVFQIYFVGCSAILSHRIPSANYSNNKLKLYQTAVILSKN